MKNIYLILFSLLVFITSCEKNPERGTFENPLLKYHGDAYVDLGLSVTDIDGGYALAGMSTVVSRANNATGGTVIESTEQDLTIIGTDPAGDSKWVYNTQSAGIDQARSICKLSDGSLVCAGVMTDEGALGKEIIVSKLGSGGSLSWTKSYGGRGNQEAYDIIESYDGGYIVLGSSDIASTADGFGENNPEGKTNVFIMKLSQNGDSLWSVSKGFVGDDIGKRIVKDLANTGYMILATTDKSAPGQGQNNLMFFRINTVGNSTNYITFGGTQNESAKDLLRTESNYILLGASGNNSESDNEMYILSLSDNIFADPVLDKRISITGSTLVINSICRHPAGFYIIAGGIGEAQEEDMLFYFMNEDGSEYYQPHIPSGQGSQVINDVIVDSDESIVAVGTNGTELSSLITFYKFKQPQ